MMNVRLLLDNEYLISEAKTPHRYLLIVNQGIIVKKSFSGATIASKILLSEKGSKKYIKCFFMWFSIVFFPLKIISKKIYLNRSDIKVAFFGRSKRVKIIKKKEIVNKINDDYFSKNDFYIRKKINDKNISPKILEFGASFFKEERIVKFKYAESIKIAAEKLKLFKSLFRTMEFSSELYVEKLLERIKNLSLDTQKSYLDSVYINSEVFTLKLVMSHGDFVGRNILVANNNLCYIIDFEFCAYRSDFYDCYYEKYYKDREQFLNQKINIKIKIFLLERLFLVLKLQKELKISYENEVKIILNTFKKNI